jgi:flagellar hook-basal body complex protein FliE
MAAGQGNLADTMIAASEASLQTQVANDLLSKAISSYNDVMNMSF